MELTLYCEHVDEKHIHCNNVTHIIIDDQYETIAHYIRTSDWCIVVDSSTTESTTESGPHSDEVDGEVRCPEHK